MDLTYSKQETLRTDNQGGEGGTGHIWKEELLCKGPEAGWHYRQEPKRSQALTRDLSGLSIRQTV